MVDAVRVVGSDGHGRWLKGEENSVYDAAGWENTMGEALLVEVQWLWLGRTLVLRGLLNASVKSTMQMMQTFKITHATSTAFHVGGEGGGGGGGWGRW